TEGEILVDDIPTHELTLNSLRQHLSFVSQDVVLFEGNIRDNVAYGAFEAVDDEQIWQALEAANLAQFVRSLPLGLETQVGEKAGNLSGGQRQRLAIARALI